MEFIAKAREGRLAALAGQKRPGAADTKVVPMFRSRRG